MVIPGNRFISDGGKKARAHEKYYSKKKKKNYRKYVTLAHTVTPSRTYTNEILRNQNSYFFQPLPLHIQK